MKATVVIGANFGDEGKGLMTDYFASPYGNGITVRFNGGAQAGHTVVTPNGKRHVFSHFGSGSFAGQSTFLSRFFISNPFLFFKELATLEEIGIYPEVKADPAGFVTTPYDMLINQFVEDFRGENRHGSVGVGFGETIERNSNPEYKILVGDLMNKNLATKLNHIRTNYVPTRLAKLGVTKYNSRLITSDALLENFINSAREFYKAVEVSSSFYLRGKDGIVFEGAQGLLLDEEHHFFPHVTRSKTGLANVLTLANEVGIDELGVNYATRAYVTRHGAGPLPWETFVAPYSKVEDKTNVPNTYQGSIRFGLLSLDLLRISIMDDLKQGGHFSNIKIKHSIALTCLDQIDGKMAYVYNNKTEAGSDGEVFETICSSIGARSGYTSYGPTREQICFVKMPKNHL
jgi:adenylosuccinate synthase